ncbi:MAG: cation:proton antiporter [Dongiaceae bacterium]
MHEPRFLIDSIIILGAAIIGVSLSERLKLGPVLGYLVAGLAIGPAGLGLITDVESTQALAELGVVFLLFAVGLELPLERIRVMPIAILWLGAAQILATVAVIAGAAFAVGVAFNGALVIGGALALSSTAIVLRLLADRKELTGRFGRTAFGVLLIQDLAVGPLIVVTLALSRDPGSIASGIGLSLLKAMLAMLVILGAGRFVLRPILQQVAATRIPEIFVALTLLVVLCAAVATQAIDLSMAFGALLAGMLLADTPYRHQVAVDIESFRGLLLGLFFMTVGMVLDLDVMRVGWGAILPLTFALIAVKTIVLFGLARALMLPTGQAMRLGLLLSQGGEFAFVLLGVGVAEGLFSAGEQQNLAAAVILSMMATPLLAILGRHLAPRVERRTVPSTEAVPSEGIDLADHIIIAGFGRVGRAVSERLTLNNIAWVAIDQDPHRVSLARKSGQRVYFGDGARPEMLEALGLAEARAVVIAIDNPKAALQLVALLHYVLPEVPVFARAYDESHAAELIKAGADHVVPEPAPIGATIAEFILALPPSTRAGPGQSS